MAESCESAKNDGKGAAEPTQWCIISVDFREEGPVTRVHGTSRSKLHKACTTAACAFAKLLQAFRRNASTAQDERPVVRAYEALKMP